MSSTRKHYIYKVDLMVKLSAEGISRIGIKYPQEYLAVKSYEDLFLKQAGNSFQLTIEILKEKLNLTLVSDANGIKIIYKEINYSADQLKKLMFALDVEKKYEFLHIYSKSNTTMIAKPFRQPTFIQLSSIHIYNPVNL